MKLVPLLILAAAPLAAQLQVALFDGTTEAPLGSITSLGSTSVSDTSTYRLRAHNNSSVAITLQSLGLAGQSFTISNHPTLPYVVAPTSFVEFRIAFTPSATGNYSASLSVNGATYMLSATGVATPVLSLASTPGVPLTAGATIDFGRLQRNNSSTLALRLSNNTTAALTVRSISVTGAAFSGPLGVTTPLNLPAGSAANFEIVFHPTTSGAQAGTLTVDTRQFLLAGTGFDAPLPQPSISISGPAASAAQPSVSINFAATPESSGNGTLTLDFTSAAAVAGDDPAIVFTASGSRQLSFQVKEGDPVATIGTQKQVVFQTGTTAGTLTFTAKVGDYTVRQTVVIPAAAVQVQSAAALRRTSDLDVTITAWDNTRSGGRFNFTFYDTKGAQVNPGVIHVDTTADFGRYFAISKVGGSFLMRATFPVTGDASQIGAVDVELVNSAGSSRTSRLNF